MKHPQCALLVVVSVAAISVGCDAAGFQHRPVHIPPVDQRPVGCLNFGAFVGRDPDFPPDTAYLELHFENTCNDPALVDLGKLGIEARRVDGTTNTPLLHDPRSEVKPLHIEPHAVAVERFQLEMVGTPEEVRAVCVDPSSITDLKQVVPPICDRATTLALRWGR